MPPKKTPAKKTASKKAPAKKAPAKKSAAKKTAAKKPAAKNKLGVKNSLVNNINARKKKGVSRPKKKGTVDKKSYGDMKDNWDKNK